MPLSSNFNAVLGAGVFGIVCAATLYVVESFRQDRRRQGMTRDLKRLDSELANVREEMSNLLELLNKQNKVARKVRKSRNKTESIASYASTSDDYTSALDSSDLEFYDVSDVEDDDETAPVAASMEAALDELDAVLDGGGEPELINCIERLTGLCMEHPGDPRLLWRIGKAHYRRYEKSDVQVVKEDHLARGMEACNSALKLKPELAEVHKWTAILIGSRTKYQPMKEKILDGYELKKHVDAAIKLSPEDSALHHMLGRFCFEIAELKWYERKIAATLFADPPSATYDEALEHFQNAEKYADYDWKENKLCIGRCLIQMGDYEKGVKCLQEASAIEIVKVADDEIEKEIQDLLKKYNSYVR